MYRVFDEEQEKQQSTNQIVVEDSGYFTGISDSSSKGSSVSKPHDQNMLIEDPVLLSNDQVQTGDTSVCILDSGDCELHSQPSNADLIFQLDALLSDEGASMLDDMVIGETQEVVTSQEEEILGSESVTRCIQELQHSGHMSDTALLEPQVCCVCVCIVSDAA